MGGLNPLEDAQEGRFPGTLGSSLEAAIAALICAKGLQNLMCLRLRMCADEHIWASSLEKATLVSAQVLLLFQLCSWLQTETGTGKEQLSVLWEMGHVAACGAGDDPFLHVGLGQSSWIRAGISHLSSADVSQRASQKLGCKCLGSCRNCLQSWDLNGVAGGNQLPCFHVFWACLLNPCLGLAF